MSVDPLSTQKSENGAVSLVRAAEPAIGSVIDPADDCAELDGLGGGLNHAHAFGS